MAKTPTIYVALTDDWELRGDGSGDMDAIQLQPMRRLASLYEKNGVRGSFFVEVMQQRTFRRFQSEYPELQSARGSMGDPDQGHVPAGA